MGINSLAKAVTFGVMLLTTPSASLAQTWGPVTVQETGFDRQKAVNEVLAELKSAPSQPIAKEISRRLFAIYLSAPDAETAEDMNQAIRAQGGYNFDKSIKILTRIIERRPDYIEAWNQRCYSKFLHNKVGTAIADCEHVIELDPKHLGSLTGLARMLIRHQKRYKAGKAVLERAIELYPFVYEKVMLDDIPKE